MMMKAAYTLPHTIEDKAAVDFALAKLNSDKMYGPWRGVGRIGCDGPGLGGRRAGMIEAFGPGGAVLWNHSFVALSCTLALEHLILARHPPPPPGPCSTTCAGPTRSCTGCRARSGTSGASYRRRGTTREAHGSGGGGRGRGRGGWRGEGLGYLAAQVEWQAEPVHVQPLRCS